MRLKIQTVIFLLSSIFLIACEEVLVLDDDFPQTWKLVKYEPSFVNPTAEIVVPDITFVFTENLTFIKTSKSDTTIFEEGGAFEKDGQKSLTLIYDRYSIKEHYEIENGKIKADFRFYDGPKVVYDRID